MQVSSTEWDILGSLEVLPRRCLKLADIGWQQNLHDNKQCLFSNILQTPNISCATPIKKDPQRLMPMEAQKLLPAELDAARKLVHRCFDGHHQHKFSCDLRSSVILIWHSTSTPRNAKWGCRPLLKGFWLPYVWWFNGRTSTVATYWQPAQHTSTFFLIDIHWWEQTSRSHVVL